MCCTPVSIVAYLLVWRIPVSVLHTCECGGTPVSVVHTFNPLTGRGSQGFLELSDQLVLLN